MNTSKRCNAISDFVLLGAENMTNELKADQGRNCDTHRPALLTPIVYSPLDHVVSLYNGVVTCAHESIRESNTLVT